MREANHGGWGPRRMSEPNPIRALRWIAFVIALVAAGPAHADEPRAKFQLSETPHVGIPFQLDLVIEGFDKTPQPEIPKLTVPDADVTFVGAQPSASAFEIIIGGPDGQRSSLSKVTWAV